MLRDLSGFNPKGHVKLELYNEQNEVFFTKEKKNLVVLTANEIVAEMMANPAKTTRMSKIDKGSTPLTANAAGQYEFALTVNRESVGVLDQDFLSTNTLKVVQLDVKNITKLISVKQGTTALVINKDVFLKDADEGIVEFAVAPTSAITFEFQTIKNPLIEMIKGTEVVKIGVDTWKRAATPVDLNKTYAINYETGKLFFENTKADINVEYSYKMNYSLGFMALGGKPTGHPDYQPVAFSNVDKILTDMQNEFGGARMPIQFPAEVSKGKPEIDVLPTKAIEYVEELETVTIVDNNLDNLPDFTGYQIDTTRRLLKIVSAKNVTNPSAPVTYVVGTDVMIEDAATAKIKFASNLTISINDKIEVVAQYQISDNHLVHQLTQAPVVELVSVVHEDINGIKTVFLIEDRGLKQNVGDVWLMNPNAGIMQFRSNPSGGVGIETPGQITVQFKVNSGTVVKFVADFPKGVPGGIKTPQEDTFTVNGSLTFQLSKTVMKDASGNFIVASVTVNGAAATSYTVHADGTKIDVTGAINGDIIVVKYSYEKDIHEIYQVAMFDGIDAVNSKMFNISGIGPVTKDKNTGMRVTWSVTF